MNPTAHPFLRAVASIMLMDQSVSSDLNPSLVLAATYVVASKSGGEEPYLESLDRALAVWAGSWGGRRYERDGLKLVLETGAFKAVVSYYVDETVCEFRARIDNDFQDAKLETVVSFDGETYSRVDSLTTKDFKHF